MEYYSILKQIVEEEIALEQLERCFEDQEDYHIVCDMISKLLEIKVLLQKEENEEVAPRELEEITLLLTNRCNLSCIHCSQSAETEGNYAQELTTEQWNEVIDRVVSADVKNIVLSGGEPMIRKDFFELVSYLREKSTSELTLMTNALLIDEKNVKKLVQCFDHISISLNYSQSSILNRSIPSSYSILTKYCISPFK